MKTIEELAREYADTHYPVREDDDPEKSSCEVEWEEGSNMGAIHGYQAGYKEAKRWIPVEERLPYDIAGRVLGLTRDGEVSNPILPKTFLERYKTIDRNKVPYYTHWLPIPPIPEK